MNFDPDEHKPDADLVLLALTGDLNAFDELIIRYRPAMVIVAEQIVASASGAEDVVQDALLLAYKALPQLDDITKFASWLYAITRHRALRYQKDNGRRPPLSELDYLILVRSSSIIRDPSQLFDEETQHSTLREAIKTLPTEYQAVIGLYYWDEMPQPQIANFLGLPLTTVKWRLHKAKELLRQHIEKGEKDYE